MNNLLGKGVATSVWGSKSKEKAHNHKMLCISRSKKKMYAITLQLHAMQAQAVFFSALFWTE